MGSVVVLVRVFGCNVLWDGGGWGVEVVAVIEGMI